jgi:hypothetical protein
MYAPAMRALVFSAILLAGCGGSQSASPASPPPPPATATTDGSAASGSAVAAASSGSPSPAVVDGMLTKMSEFKDKICACPDETCLNGVQDEMKQWNDDLSKQGIKNPTLTDDQTKRAAALGEALGKCLKRIGNMGG